MTIREIMSKQVQTIGPSSTLTEAAKRMDDVNVGALPVLENDKLLGIITDRDVVIRSISIGQNPNEARVRDTMTSPAITCVEDQALEEVIQIFKSKQVRRLPVLSRDQKLVGIITVDDLARRAKNDRATVEVLRSVSDVEKPAA